MSSLFAWRALLFAGECLAASALLLALAWLPTHGLRQASLRHLVWVTAFGTLLVLPARASAPTRVVILPVNHSQQLVARSDQPGFLTALIQSLKPDAICIEVFPRAYARNDFYDFAYEQTGIIVPYARAHRIALYPIDWEPERDDMLLAFGSDLDETPLIRPKAGWGAFLTFPDAKDLKAPFLDPQPDVIAHVQRWAKTDPADPSQDAPRRLYLYRTFLQARRIAQVARAHPGGTVLVVIGEFHKWDIERTLAHDPAIRFVQPKNVFVPDEHKADALTTPAQRVAILSFNLLGLQAAGGNVDWDWMRAELATLPKSEPASEREIFAIRLGQLTHELTPADAIARYQALIAATPADLCFTWTGAKDPARLDSYFDPFGNLTIRQRARLELARAQAEAGQTEPAKTGFAALLRELNGQQAFQAETYAPLYLWPGNAKG
jgi:hypothetical protein